MSFTTLYMYTYTTYIFSIILSFDYSFDDTVKNNTVYRYVHTVCTVHIVKVCVYTVKERGRYVLSGCVGLRRSL